MRFKTISVGNGLFAKISPEDYDVVSSFSWSTIRSRHTHYAYRGVQEGGKRKIILMHRQINGTPHGMVTDHIDGDGMNNVRENLRSVSFSQNAMNRRVRADSSSGVRGVSYDAARGNWRAQVFVNRKRRFIKRFPTLELAKEAVEAARASLHGEYVRD